jgi:translation elongation factor EF-1alpha
MTARVLVMPAGDAAQVKSVAIDDEAVDYGFAGDQVSRSVLTGTKRV